MYFSEIPSGLSGAFLGFANRLSDELERMDLALMDRDRCTITCNGESARIELPHRDEPDFGLRFDLVGGQCILQYGDAHRHFDGDDWQEQAMDFLTTLLFGHIEIRSWRVREHVVRVYEYAENESGEWERISFVFYRPRFGVSRRSVRRICFSTDADRLRLLLAQRPEATGEYRPLPGNFYISQIPVDIPESAKTFLNLLIQQLEKHRPPMLDERRTRALRFEGADGRAFLRVTLPHRTEWQFPVYADVYGDQCVLHYGNGLMRVDGEGWLDATGTMLGLILFGKIEVRSIYRGGRLVSVATRFLDEPSGRRDWKRRVCYRWFGKRRVDARRVDYFSQSI
jgi:hypothetical protein